VFDDELREALGARAAAATLKRLARSRGIRTMRRAGLDLVADGSTTLAELDRVTFVEPDDEP
jgi:general secretion pathway protein E